MFAFANTLVQRIRCGMRSDVSDVLPASRSGDYSGVDGVDVLRGGTRSLMLQVVMPLVFACVVHVAVVCGMRTPCRFI